MTLEVAKLMQQLGIDPDPAVNTARLILDSTDYAIRSITTIRKLADKLSDTHKRIVEFHRQVCSPENCVLDGGEEHQEAFDNSTRPAEAAITKG